MMLKIGSEEFAALGAAICAVAEARTMSDAHGLPLLEDLDSAIDMLEQAWSDMCMEKPKD